VEKHCVKTGDLRCRELMTKPYRKGLAHGLRGGIVSYRFPKPAFSDVVCICIWSSIS